MTISGASRRRGASGRERLVRLSARLAACLALALGAASCAGSEQVAQDPLVVAVAARFPACAQQFKALVALEELAAQSADGPDVYGPALDAMRDQVKDCVVDQYAPPSDVHLISGSSPAPEPRQPKR